MPVPELPVPTLCAQDPAVLPLPTQDIQDLLTAWAQHLEEAQRIFLRAPRHNRALLFGGRNPPLSRGDPRICHIPLSTRRATLREVLRVHAALATLQVYGESAQPWCSEQLGCHGPSRDPVCVTGWRCQLSCPPSIHPRGHGVLPVPGQ